MSEADGLANAACEPPSWAVGNSLRSWQMRNTCEQINTKCLSKLDSNSCLFYGRNQGTSVAPISRNNWRSEYHRTGTGLMNFASATRTVLFLMALTAFGTTANAAGEPPRFQGLYGGLVSGYGFADESWSQPGGAAAPLPAGANFDLEGGLAGLTAGHNWNLGNFLLGIEVDGTTLEMDDSQPCGLMGAICTVDLNALVTARGRAGVFFGSESQFMAYVTGGLALAWIEATSPAPGATLDFTEATYAVGGGFEGYVMDTDWVSTKLEYLFVGVNDTKSYTVGLNPAVIATLKLNGIHLFRWGWNIHF